MKCEKCGKELSLINVNVFNYDGTDKFVSNSYNEYYFIGIELDENYFEIARNRIESCLNDIGGQNGLQKTI